jgi:hypothetical protein
MKLKPFDYIFIVLIAIIIGLSFWIYRLYQNNDNSILEDLHRSQGRVELLDRQLKKEILKSDSLVILRDSIITLKAIEPKERIVIITKYYDKIKNIDNQSVSVTLQSITGRLNP